MKKILRVLWYAFWTLILYLGISLLGYGITHLGEFFSSSPRLGYATVVGLFSVAIGFQAYFNPEGIDGGKGVEGKFVFRQRILAYILVYAMFFAFFFIPYFDRREIGVFSAPQALRYLGVILSALGYGLIFLSGLELGRHYSPDVTIQKDHQLITSGLYHLVRHPRYLGVVVLAVGLPLVFRSWIGLSVSLFFIALIYLRIKDEEKTMLEEFGLQWEAYCQRSWRLLPYIY